MSENNTFVQPCLSLMSALTLLSLVCSSVVSSVQLKNVQLCVCCYHLSHATQALWSNHRLSVVHFKAVFEIVIKVPQLKDSKAGPVHTGRKAECIHWFSILTLGTVCPWPSVVILALGKGVCQCSGWKPQWWATINIATKCKC